MKKPVLSAAAQPLFNPRPQTGHVPKKELWKFSLRFWRQIDNFGLGDQSANWFVSLCDRLRDLSSIQIEDFLRDSALRTNFRFHEIDWEAKNVPLRRTDFNWIDKDYLDNEAEYPFFQFHVSKALGRVVGFFDENKVFNVVLLDPNHNIQPSRFSSYNIRPTRLGACQYSVVVSAASQVFDRYNQNINIDRAKFVLELEEISITYTSGIVICRLSEEAHGRIRDLREAGQAASLDEILECAFELYEPKRV